MRTNTPILNPWLILSIDDNHIDIHMERLASGLHFSDLDIFLTLCESASLTEAAKKRNTSQPALSAVLKRIETDLGARLFERDRNGLRINQAGNRFRDYCETTLRSFRLMKAGDSAWQSHKVRLGAHPSVAGYLLPRFLASFSNPGATDFEFRHGLSRVVQEWILNREVDMGFVINPIRHADLHIRKLGDDVVTIFGRPGARSKMLIGDPNLRQTRSILKQLDRPGKHKFLNGIKFTPCDNLEVVKTLALAGACFGILPARVADTQAGEAVLKPFLRAPKMYDEICVVARADCLRENEHLRTTFRLARNALDT